MIEGRYVIDVIALLFVLFTLSRVVLRAKDKKLSLGEIFFWSAIWIILLLVVFFPGITSPIAAALGIGRGVDVIIYSSISLLFYLIFRLYVRIEEMEQEITRIVRDISYTKKKK